MTALRLLVTAVALAISTSAHADNSARRSITKLFAPIAKQATVATVSVLCDNKKAVLGTVMDKSGLILTKGSELKGVISVRLSDGTVYDAKQLGYHEPSDLALISIESNNELTPIAKFADGSAAKVGNWIAVTNLDEEPVSVGIVSANVRRLFGEESIIDNLNKGFLGISAPSQESAEADGVIISGIADGGGAALARMKVGDVILSVAGKSVKKFEDLKKILDKYKPDETVKVLIRRDDTEKEINVKLVKKAKIDRGDYQNTLAGELSARRTGFPSVLSHDSAIKPFECGGPIVDLSGNILGINIARAGRVETWALPAEVIRPIYADLKAGKYPVANDEKK